MADDTLDLVPVLDPRPGRAPLHALTGRGQEQRTPLPNGSDSAHGASALANVARGGSLNIAGALCNQIALFGATAFVARALGKTALGQYALGLAILSLVGAVALFGFQMALTRYVAVHLADADPARLRGTIRIGLGCSVGLSLALSTLIAASAPALASVFHQPGFASDLRLIALALPAWTLRDACLAAVKGWRTQRAFALVTWVYEPVLRLSLTIGAVSLGLGLTGAFAALTIGSWAAALLAIHALAKKLRGVPRRRPIFEMRMVSRFATISLGTGLASVGLVWADLLILGVMSDSASVGVYNVATKLVNLAVFVMLPINAAFAPQFAHLMHRKSHDSLNQAYRTATTWILRLSFPAFVVLIVFPQDMLRIFGPKYAVAATVTVILAIGQLVNAATGPCGTLLNMGGRVGLNMVNNIAVLLLNIVLNIFLIPSYGIIGAAIAWSVSLGVVNIARIIEVRVIMNTTPFEGATARILVAAGAATIAALSTRYLISQSLTQLAVGIAAMLTVYIGVEIMFGLDTEDRALLASLVHR